MKIVITEDCAGTGQCVAIAPDIFELDSDGLATVVRTPDTGEQRDMAQTAADLCPMAAIHLEE